MQKKQKDTWLSLMYFTDELWSSCREISLTSPKDIELCFHSKVIFQVFVSFTFMSYNPDTGIKNPHFSLKHLEWSTLETQGTPP